MSPIEIQRHRRALLGAYALALLALTLAPMPDTGGLATDLDKLIHLGMFGARAGLVHWNLIPAMPRGRAVALATLTAALAAGLIEIIQDPLPYRDGDLGDFLAGVTGGMIGAVAAMLVSGSRGR